MGKGEIKTDIKDTILTKHNYYFETPLYTIINGKLLAKDIFKCDVDAYSAKNSIDTTYSININMILVESRRMDGEFEVLYPILDSTLDYIKVGFFLVTLRCKRKDNDVLQFIIYLDRVKSEVVKIGQFPSLADLQFSEIDKKYSKVLSEEDLTNLKKAIGLAAHGIGAGSFVYLRRIFENLIQKTFKNGKEFDVSELDFKKKKIEEKIEILKTHLPSRLIEMKNIYVILSKGVHELSEDECQRHFNFLKLSIELILDQKIKEEREKKKDINVKKQISSITRELNKPINKK